MHFAKPSVLIGALILAAALLAGAGGAHAQTRAATANTERTVVSGGMNREYILHMPRGAAASPGPRPLVIALHGALQPAGMMQRYLDLDAIADREGFVVAYPKGLNLLWNDGRSSIAGFIPLLYKRDDGRFIVDLLDKLVAQGIADPSRAYLMGFSNGGFLTAYIACRYADRFQAYATLMMTVPVGYSETCRPSKPIPILLMNGTYDPIVPMFGRPTPGARLMSADATAALFARLNGCGKPEVAGAPQARITRWTRCAPGGEVAYYEVAGGHQPPAQSTGAVDALASVLLGPRRSGLDAPEEVWSFFKRYGGPPATPAVPEALVAARQAPAQAPAQARAPAPAAPATIGALALAATTGARPAPLSGPAPILRNPASPETAWQGIAPTAQSVPVAAQTTVPALHRPLAAGAPMPLQSDFVRAGSAPGTATAAPTTVALVPLPPPSPLRRRAASVQ